MRMLKEDEYGEMCVDCCFNPFGDNVTSVDDV